MTNVATRLISLILLLQTRPSWKVAELAAELGVSERTVHRYLEMLEEMGIPIYSERGPYGGFSLLRGYKLPPLIFTPEEATVLTMGAGLVRTLWGQTYADAVTSVTAKLNNVLPDDLRQEIAEAQERLVIVGVTARDYRPWEPLLHTLRGCLGRYQRVQLEYQGFSQELTCREVDPYALAFYGGFWYLVGYCHLRQELRTFRVDRIQKVTPLHVRFNPPRDFSAREYMVRTMRMESRATAVVELAAVVAPIVRERYGHWMELAEHEDGSVTARFGISDLDWPAGWVLGWGAAARVLAPPELIARVKQEAETLLRQYQTEP